jgi:AraC-like DNA-binding protein
MDPLSDVLSLLKPRSYNSGGFDMGGSWSIRFDPHDGVKCYALAWGECWLSVEGVAEPVHLFAGDCFLLPRGWPFVLASDLALTPADAHTVFHTPLNGALRVVNGGGGCVGVGGFFAFAGRHAGILLGMLPPIVHIRRESDRATLRWCIERMMQELRDPAPGGHLVAQFLSQMMLVQALRLHLTEGASGEVGWLFALADGEMGTAITAMHDAPARRWTLQELADHVGMSRSNFAFRFKTMVGLSPMDYLTRWRMLLAGDRLTNGDDSVSTIARSLGYESESAFSTAFKRVMGCSPRQYCRGHTSARYAAPTPHPIEALPI